MGTSHAAGWGPDSPTPAQLKEFFDQITSGKLSRARMQAIIRGSGRWDETSPPPREQLLLDWEVFYDVYFGTRVNFAGIRIPPHTPGYDRVILIPQELTWEMIRDGCNRQFSCGWHLNANEHTVPRNQRSARECPYAIRVRECEEPDEDMAYVDVDHIHSGGIATMTLRERLVFGLKYYTETGRHLDQMSVTMCVGSSDEMGYIPVVNWGTSVWDTGRPNELFIGAFKQGDTPMPRMVRARRVIA